ncbi:Virginiamycin B lyase [Paraconexibacter sp. AEG42_29]|uniref:Virginiamycin B lyase n=1 Tax=Paraconexibacter sp. AEG42_29 TaxID=2997339 RepID=A0AAU7APD9_9ACTN
MIRLGVGTLVACVLPLLLGSASAAWATSSRTFTVGVQSASDSCPNAQLTQARDGSVWFNDDHRIGRIAPTGQIRYFGIGPRYDAPCALTAGQDGAIWFVADVVGESTPGVGSEVDVQVFGRIAPDGALRFFAVPELSGRSTQTAKRADHLSEGPDGSLWFLRTDVPQAATDADQIQRSSYGRITQAGVVEILPHRFRELETSIGFLERGPTGKLLLWNADFADSNVLGVTSGTSALELNASGVLGQRYDFPLSPSGAPAFVGPSLEENFRDPDGSWFRYGVERRLNANSTTTDFRLGRLTATGKITLRDYPADVYAGGLKFSGSGNRSYVLGLGPRGGVIGRLPSPGTLPTTWLRFSLSLAEFDNDPVVDPAGYVWARRSDTSKLRRIALAPNLSALAFSRRTLTGSLSSPSKLTVEIRRRGALLRRFVSATLKAGTFKVPLAGRGGRPLAAGRYTIAASAADGLKFPSAKRTLAIRIG